MYNEYAIAWDRKKGFDSFMAHVEAAHRRNIFHLYESEPWTNSSIIVKLRERMRELQLVGRDLRG